MTQQYRDLLFTTTVQNAKAREGKRLFKGETQTNADRLGPKEQAFIARR